MKQRLNREHITSFFKKLGNLVKEQNRFLRLIKNPLSVQEEVLKQILHENRNTYYGKKYKFASIKDIKSFQKKVPIITYADILPLVERLKNGEQRLLTKKDVTYFATTSGSTSTPKLIPITKDRVKNFRKEFALWSLYVLKQHRDILPGKTLYFAGPYDEGKTDAGIMYGSISGYLAWNTPWVVKNKLVVPAHIYNIFDFEKKTFEIALHALCSNITQIGFAAPIEAILFFDYLQEKRQLLIAELFNRGYKRRAKKLQKLPNFKPITIWPKIGLINCIKSEAQIPYLEVLKEKIGKQNIPIRDPGIYASEGRISIGLLPGVQAVGYPLGNVNFFEFLEVRKDGPAKPVTIDKVRRKKQYQVIMTTPEGLYRYDMGDVIEVVRFEKKLPVIKFVNRNNFLNIVGELSPESELVSAFTECAKKLKIRFTSFTFTPYLKELDKKPRYELLIEPKEGLQEQKAKELIKLLDQTLQERINDYRQMRNEFGRMGSIVLSVLKKGSYDSYNKKRFGGQPKPIHVHKSSTFREEFEIITSYR